MEKNSFQELQLENEAKFAKASTEVKRNVRERRDIWSLIGDLFELYIPRFFSALIGSNEYIERTGLQNDDKT